MTTASETRPTLAPHVLGRLGALRRRIRLYVWAEGLGSTAVWLGVAFWMTLAIDWFFEPPARVRVVMLCVAAVVFAWVVVQLIVRRAFVRLSDSNMAMLLERQFPELKDSLLTAVVLSPRSPEVAHCDPQMLDDTCRQAAHAVTQVKLSNVFNPVPLRRSLTAAILLGLSVAVFAHQSPQALGTWTRRMLLSNELWPRKTHLLVEGFHDGVRKVARGGDLQLIVKADTRWPRVPKAVEVRYRADGNVRRRATMNRLGREDPFQKYSYTFQGVLSPIRFDVVGGDCRLYDLRIEVVESPTVDMQLKLIYPAYTQRASRTIPVTGSMPVPRGTDVTILAHANKDLREVKIEQETGKQLLPRKVIDDKALQSDARRFEYRVASLHDDMTLLFTLSDTDGITTYKPIRLALEAVEDEAPRFEDVRLVGIGQAITAEARLPAEGRVTDDYGLGQLAFKLGVNEHDPVTRPVDAPRQRATEMQVKAAVEVRDLTLTPGQTLSVGLMATDLYDLEDEPNVGSSDFGVKEIVTPDQLRAMLESQELVLRQRLELIVEEVVETRDLLLRLDFTETTDREATAQEKAESAATPGAEPGDEPADRLAEKPSSPQHQITLRHLSVERTLQNSRKNAYETLALAESVDDIRRQLINNRIDTEELNKRLEQGVAEPLQRVGETMFPLLQQQLELLRAKVDDRQLGPQYREVARQQTDAILIEMQKVLQQMIELEDFNEAVELLRSIIKLQEKLGEKTKRRQKAELLGD